MHAPNVFFKMLSKVYGSQKNEIKSVETGEGNWDVNYHSLPVSFNHLRNQLRARDSSSTAVVPTLLRLREKRITPTGAGVR